MAKIELLKQWRHCRPGFVMTDVQESLAELLVARKIGRIVAEVQPEKPAKQQTKQAKGQ